MGWVESQQVVEGGGIYKCECGENTIVYSVAVSFS
jgi:hypothetical protein